jgi:DtxR family transcriptional regulator, Mn-dependent transcriptional regulator
VYTQTALTQSETSELSTAIQDYLKSIHALESEDVKVTTSALAQRMGVSSPSATAMAKRLAELGLVQRAPYRGVVLTEAGRRAALEVLRHHRLLEQYLAKSLGLPLAEVHAEADRLEHALSEELEARIDEALGFPTHDPHGHPIPSRTLELESVADRTLANLVPGERSTVTGVPDRDPELLRYLTTLSLLPGEVVEVRHAAPFGGPLTIFAGGAESAVSRELAGRISVEAPAVTRKGGPAAPRGRARS